MGYKARAVTGSTGYKLIAGVDIHTLRTDPAANIHNVSEWSRPKTMHSCYIQELLCNADGYNIKYVENSEGEVKKVRKRALEPYDMLARYILSEGFRVEDACDYGANGNKLVIVMKGTEYWMKGGVFYKQKLKRGKS